MNFTSDTNEEIAYKIKGLIFNLNLLLKESVKRKLDVLMIQTIILPTIDGEDKTNEISVEISKKNML